MVLFGKAFGHVMDRKINGTRARGDFGGEL